MKVQSLKKNEIERCIKTEKQVLMETLKAERMKDEPQPQLSHRDPRTVAKMYGASIERRNKTIFKKKRKSMKPRLENTFSPIAARIEGEDQTDNEDPKRLEGFEGKDIEDVKLPPIVNSPRNQIQIKSRNFINISSNAKTMHDDHRSQFHQPTERGKVIPDPESEISEPTADFIKTNKQALLEIGRSKSPEMDIGGQKMRQSSYNRLIKEFGIDGTIKKKKPTKTQDTLLRTEERAKVKRRHVQIKSPSDTAFKFNYPKMKILDYRKQVEKDLYSHFNPPIVEQKLQRVPSPQKKNYKYYSYVQPHLYNSHLDM